LPIEYKLPKRFISTKGRISYDNSMTLIDQAFAQVADVAAYTSIASLDYLEDPHFTKPYSRDPINISLTR